MSCQSQRSSRINIDEEIYLSEDEKDKVEKYFYALTAQSVSLETTRDSNYSFSLEVIGSKKFEESSESKQDWISQTLARIIAEEIGYADEGTELQVSFAEKEREAGISYTYRLDSILESRSLFQRLEGNADQAQFSEAQMAYQGFDFHKAAGHLNNILYYYPNDEKALALRAETFAEMDEYNYAIEDFETLVTINASNEQYYFRLAEVLFDYDEPEYAQQNLDSVIYLTDSSHLGSFLLQGEIAIGFLSDFELAEVYFNKAIELAPEKQEVWLARRRLFVETEEEERACQDLLTASKLGPLPREASIALRLCRISD